MLDLLAAWTAAATWFAAPISGADTHSIDPRIAWHARTMVLAWSILLPLGALIARFLKIVPGQDWPRELDRSTWWNAHRGLQYGGVLVSLIGVTLAWPATTNVGWWRNWHGFLGWVVIVAGIAQVIGGWLRGTTGGPPLSPQRGLGVGPAGDHYGMTGRRILFERMHKTLGWGAVALALVVTMLGLVIADAPRWMVLLVGVWWVLLATAFVVLQRAGWCVDTYQAIWGPSPAHPGNRVPPIGVGIRRGDAIGQVRKARPDAGHGT
jgi:hypothetical protein